MRIMSLTKSLRNGKGTWMDKKSFVSASELCKIIGIASKSNVRSLEFGDVKMAFGQIDQFVPQPLDEIQTRSFEKKSKQIVAEVEAQAKEAAREEALQNLQLLDPLAYERFVVEGENGAGENP